MGDSSPVGSKPMVSIYRKIKLPAAFGCPRAFAEEVKYLVNGCRMGEVLPLCDSLLSLFVSSWTVSYQKVSQSFKDVVSSFSKFRWAVPGWRSTGGRPVMFGNEILWFTFSIIPSYCMTAAFLNLMGDLKVSMILAVLKSIFALGGLMIHSVVMYSIMYWHRDMPFRLIGAEAKFMIEFIPMITGAALHHLLVFNYWYLSVLVGCTSYVYVFAHFMRAAYDIGGKDVLMGLVMQVLAYMVNGKLLVRALALSFCFGLCFYRYMTYWAPEVPAHRKKELKRLPC